MTPVDEDLAVDGIACKSLRVLDYAVRVCGYPSDPYFDTIELRASEFFFYARVLEGFVKPGSVIMDVGANIGATLALAHRIAKPRSAGAIEPAPRAFASLRQTERCAEAEGVSILLEAGAGAASGRVAFEQSPFLAGSHIRAEGGVEGEIIE